MPARRFFPAALVLPCLLLLLPLSVSAEMDWSEPALFARSRKSLRQNEAEVLRLAEAGPDLPTLGAPKYFRHDGDLAQGFVRATVDGIQRRDYRFIGEILYSHADKRSGRQYLSGERYVDPLAPRTAELPAAVAPLHIPLMTHWEVYNPGRDFPRFHQLYEAWPEQVFIVPHMGFASSEQVAEFMDRHPNVWMTISKKDRPMRDFSDPAKQAMIGSAFLDGLTLRPEWKALLVRFQDRLLAATDAHMRKLWEVYPTSVNHLRIVLGQLPRDAAEKIAYRNAERLYGVAVR